MAASITDHDRDRRLRQMLDEERESAWMYERLAAISRSEAMAATLRDLAVAEGRHARHWADRLGDLALLDAPLHPTLRVRALVLLARVAGVNAVLPRLRAAELDEISRYEAEPEARALADEERAHRAILGTLTEGTGAPEAEHGFASASAASTFRAALFGLNDGLVSNLSLIAGVAGAAIESNAVLIAGIAGWLAGAFSMGAGEYVSVRSQTELFEHELGKERLELELDPEGELNELVAIYERKGIAPTMAHDLATEIMKDPETALDTHAREELGLDPQNLGAPWPAAIGSFLAFSLGAVVPVLPFIITSGYTALVAAIIAGTVMLALVGMLTSLLTGRHPLYAGLRMVLIGLVATGVTFGIGSVIPIDL